MKRSMDLVQKELESDNEGEVLIVNWVKDEEPIIKNVLINLSEAVSKKRASDLLHSMVTVINTAELVDYVLLPYN